MCTGFFVAAEGSPIMGTTKGFFIASLPGWQFVNVIIYYCHFTLPSVVIQIKRLLLLTWRDPGEWDGTNGQTDLCLDLCNLSVWMLHNIASGGGPTATGWGQWLAKALEMG